MISSFLVFVIATVYAMCPQIAGAISPDSESANTARFVGSLVAGLAAFAAFPSASILRYFNVVLGIALMLSPVVRPDWPVTALVIQVVTGSWVTALSLLPRRKARVVTGGGWHHVFSSPSRIDRIETSGI